MKVCFVSTKAYPLFNPVSRIMFGGIETRSWLFGRHLAKLPGFKVSFLVKDEGQEPKKKYGNITVYTYQCRHPANAINPVFKLVNADVYVCFGVNSISSEVVSACKQLGKPVLLSIASDNDLSTDYYKLSETINRYRDSGHLCYYTIAYSDQIMVQTEKQKQLLMELFRRPSTIIKNPIDIVEDTDSLPDYRDRKYALWIGRSDNFHKRPDVCIKLARMCPHIPFKMILNRSDSDIYRAIEKNKPANVRIIEHVPFQKMPAYFSNARVFLTTSSAEFEGFPNVILQAGKYSTPVLSSGVDPDAFMTTHGCGLVSKGSIQELAGKLRALWNNHELCDSLTERMRHYLLKNHDIQNRTSDLAVLLNETVKAPRQIAPSSYWDTQTNSVSMQFLSAYARERYLHLNATNERLAIFPCGKHTKWLLTLTADSAGTRPPLLLDDSISKPEQIYGHQAFPAKFFRKLGIKAVILSTDSPALELRKRARKLFGSKLIDFYQGLPHGPYMER